MDDTLEESKNKIGFRNAHNNSILDIPRSLLDESKKRFLKCITNQQNLLETKTNSVNHKKMKLKLKKQHAIKRTLLCSYKPFVSPLKNQKTKTKIKQNLNPNHNKKTENQYKSSIDIKSIKNKKRISSKIYSKLPQIDVLRKTTNRNQKNIRPMKTRTSRHSLPLTRQIKNNSKILTKNKNLTIKSSETNQKNQPKLNYKKLSKLNPKNNQSFQNDNSRMPLYLNKSKIRLSKDQQKILFHVLEGKNVFFTGCAGTGKSVLIRQIYDHLKARKKEVHVTASTGLAAHNLNGKTLHSWSGIGFGKGNPNDIYRKIRRQAVTFKRWTTSEVLIIDEISMISGTLFEKIEYIARKIRKNELPFGGIQIVLCGDFLQLPPVNVDKLTFEANSWPSCIPDTHMFELTEVFRQQDETFVEMLSELRRGILSKTTENTLNHTSKNNLPENSVVIHSHRKTVARKNALKLKSLKGESHFYESVDSSPTKLPADYIKKLLNNCPIPMRLALKIGAPVILMKNIDEVLVNGLSGVVTAFRKEDGDEEHLPVVYFRNLEKKVVIERIAWKIERGDGTILASRKQLPLNLSWALTIHKCQGMTLDHAVMDLGAVWEPGHFYVAVSRLRSLRGLKIIGDFNKNCVKANAKVIIWMKKKNLLAKQRPAMINNSQNNDIYRGILNNNDGNNCKNGNNNGGNNHQNKNEKKKLKLRINEEKISFITRPFESNGVKKDKILEYHQRRIIEDRVRRKSVVNEMNFCIERNDDVNKVNCRRFSISDKELKDFDSIMDGLVDG